MDEESPSAISEVFWELFVDCINTNSPLYHICEVISSSKKGRSEDRLALFSRIEKFERDYSLHELFQRDELLDDISCSSIKFLLLPYMKAQCLESVNDLKARHGALLTAKLNYSLFVHETCWYARESKRFLKAQEEFELFGGLDYENPRASSISAEERRSKVITRRQTIKSIEERCDSEHIAEARKGEDSAEVHNFWVDILYGAVLDSITCTDLINQELPLIARFQKDAEKGQNEKDDSHGMRLDGTGKILSKPFIMRISNSAELRKYYASRVLQPGHILPTISIAEAGLYDMKLEVEGLQAAQKKTVKEYKEGSSEETEENLGVAEEEAKELKARKWDDWKDAHPKGSGNTMVNRG